MTLLISLSGYGNIPIRDVKPFIVPSYGGPIRENTIHMFTPILVPSRHASIRCLPRQRTDH